MPCHAMPWYRMPWYRMPCHAMPSHAISSDLIPSHPVPYECLGAFTHFSAVFFETLASLLATLGTEQGALLYLLSVETPG